MITWNHITVYGLLLLDRNTWNYKTMWKSFELDRNTWLIGWVYGIPTIVGYLMPNPLNTYILDIYDLGWLDFYSISSLLVI